MSRPLQFRCQGAPVGAPASGRHRPSWRESAVVRGWPTARRAPPAWNAGFSRPARGPGGKCERGDTARAFTAKTESTRRNSRKRRASAQGSRGARDWPGDAHVGDPWDQSPAPGADHDPGRRGPARAGPRGPNFEATALDQLWVGHHLHRTWRWCWTPACARDPPAAGGLSGRGETRSLRSAHGTADLPEDSTLCHWNR